MPLVADDVERAGLTFSVFWHQLQLFRKITRLLQTRGIEQYHACYGTRKEGVERKFDVGTTKSKNTVEDERRYETRRQAGGFIIEKYK